MAARAQMVRVVSTLFPHVELDKLAAAVRIVAARQTASVLRVGCGEVVCAVAVAWWKCGDDCRSWGSADGVVFAGGEEEEDVEESGEGEEGVAEERELEGDFGAAELKPSGEAVGENTNDIYDGVSGGDVAD